MKPPSKMSLVASSPGRAEKQPAPPFSRLLKGKGGSRSRRSSSLSRASPMFMTRRRSGTAEAEGDKEPGSPKVTCIGQVRITKKKKKPKNAVGDQLPTKEEQKRTETAEKHHQQQDVAGESGCCECACFHPAGFCNPFTKLPKPKRSRAAAQAQPPQQGSSHRTRRRAWRGWFSPRCCYSRERKEQKQLLESEAAVEAEDEADCHAKPRDFYARSPVRREWMSKVAAATSEDGNAAGEPSKEEEDTAASKSKVDGDLAPTTPPKNALLLMRCRSAPQGASSPFARRIVVAPDADETTTKWLPGPRPETDTAACGSGSSSSAFFRANKVVEESIKAGGDPSTINDAGRGSGGFAKLECTTRDSGANAEGSTGEGCTSEEQVDTADEDAASAVGPSTSFSSVPLILTRCQSAPAHKAAKLAPESSSRLWNGSATDNNTNKGGKSVQHTVLGRGR